MDQNFQSQNNDQTQNGGMRDPAQGTTYTSSVKGTSGNEGNRTSDSSDLYTSSYSYGASVPSPAPRKKGRGSRAVLVAVAAVLCLAMCFGAGALGSLLVADLLVRDPSDVSRQPVDGNILNDGTADDDLPIGNTDTPKTDADADASGTQVVLPSGTQSRNPLPEMSKSESLGSVSYTGSAGDRAYGTLVEAIDAVNQTVVEIFTETIVNGGWLGNYVTDGAGSGVIISKDGYIVTNNHVISGASSIQVRTVDGTTYTAQLVGTDEAADIAVLWIDSETELPAAQLGCSADLVVGEYVFAIGNPLGSLGGTVTDGIISATARSITVDGQPMTLLQTNAAVNPGNSGGGLFNMAGQLIGVVNAKASADNVEGLGFAIPIDTAYQVICQLIEYGYVRGVVDTGLELYDVSSSNILVALRYFGMSHAGVYVLDSAYSDEIKYGDLLVSVNGVTVDTGAEAEAIFKEYAVGDTVTLTLLRMEMQPQNGRQVGVETTVKVELTLQEYVPEDAGIHFERAE